MKMSKRLALVTGSFDPITNGHVDIVRRAAKIFDEVLVLVAQNDEKTYMFSPEERAEIARAALLDVPDVRVENCFGFVSDYAKECGASAFVRGVRGEDDLAYEEFMANRNFELCGVDTVLLFANPKVQGVSSTMVRECIKNGSGAEKFMPPAAFEVVKNIILLK
jgi:pantetheine-phosphate adenylyltransferase